VVSQLSEQDMKDIVNGACLYGAGGGGPWSLGMTLVQQIVAAGRPVELAETSALPAQALTAVSAGVGSPDAAGSGFPYDAPARAFDALASRLGTRLGAVLPAELGAANSIVPMTTAAIHGIPVLDAAGSPRAVPQLAQSTFAVRGAPIGTVVLANAAQRVSFDCDAGYADAVMRAVISSGMFTEDAGAALWAMDMALAGRVAVPGCTGMALSLGRALREAVASGGDPVGAVVAGLGGRELVRGRVVSSTEATAGGFDTGVVTVQSAPAAGGAGRTLRIINQNENLIAWFEDEDAPCVLAPDLIVFMTVAGQPFSNADLDLVRGQEVVVIGAPVLATYRDAAVVEAFVALLRAAGYGGPWKGL
jgi:DUF917 family protein